MWSSRIKIVAATAAVLLAIGQAGVITSNVARADDAPASPTLPYGTASNEAAIGAFTSHYPSKFEISGTNTVFNASSLNDSGAFGMYIETDVKEDTPQAFLTWFLNMNNFRAVKIVRAAPATAGQRQLFTAEVSFLNHSGTPTIALHKICILPTPKGRVAICAFAAASAEQWPALRDQLTDMAMGIKYDGKLTDGLASPFGIPHDQPPEETPAAPAAAAGPALHYGEATNTVNFHGFKCMVPSMWDLSGSSRYVKLESSRDSGQFGMFVFDAADAKTAGNFLTDTFFAENKMTNVKVIDSKAESDQVKTMTVSYDYENAHYQGIYKVRLNPTPRGQVAIGYWATAKAADWDACRDQLLDLVRGIHCPGDLAGGRTSVDDTEAQQGDKAAAQARS